LLLAACLAAACTAQRDSSGEQPARQIGFEGSHVLVHPDGDALIVGIASSRGRGARCGRDKNERRYFQVVRVRPSGRVADTFDFVPDDDCAAEVSSTLLQPDGKLLLSGWIFHPSDAGFEDNSSQGPFVARFLPSGELDRSFGGDGRIGTGEPSAKIALQPDGAIVSASGRRLGHQGKFDEDFMPRVADSTFAGGIATLPDGSFFVASLVRSRMRSFVLQRFDRQGQVMGQTLTSFAGDEAVADAEVLDVIAAAGRIYVLGRFSLEVGSSAHFFLYR
jgi:hypothetical protein